MFSFCTNLESFSSDLSSLTNGEWMFLGCSKLTSFDSDLSSLTNGHNMFSGCELDAASLKRIAISLSKTNIPNTVMTINLGMDYVDNGNGTVTPTDAGIRRDLNLITHKGWILSYFGDYDYAWADTDLKYAGCTTIDAVEAKDANYLSNDIVSGVWFEHLPDLTNGSTFFQYRGTLTSFNADLSSLTDGTDMFYSCLKLATFTSNLSSLRHGYRMFYNCQKLTTFNSKLPSLWNGSQMFCGCDTLTTFNSDMPILENGEGMFNHADNLTTFNSLMPSLTNGDMMFVTCTKLTSFYSDLSSLTSGFQMFTDCKLDVDSMENIANTLPNTTNGRIDIRYGYPSS